MNKIKLLFLFFGLSFNLVYSQCVDLVFSDCVQLNQTSTVSTTHLGNASWASVIDPNGNQVSGINPYSYQPSIDIPFNIEGTYTISLSVPDLFCYQPEIFEIEVNNSDLSVTSNDIDECENQTISLGDYISLNNISIEPLTYSWSSSQGNFTGASPSFLVPENQTTINLTVTDGSGCQASTSFNITPTPTSISAPSFTQNPSNIQCAGEEITFQAEDTSTENYEWYIQGDTLTGSTISTTLFPVNANSSDLILIELIALDNISGCQISTSEYIEILPTPIIELDTNINFWSTESQSFVLCEGDYINSSFTSLEFINSNSIITDSVIIDWGNGNIITIDGQFDSPINVQYNNSNNYDISVTPYNNGCNFTTNYEVYGGLIIDSITGGEIGYVQESLCTDSASLFYLKDQYGQAISEIGPNDTITWTVICEGSTILFEEVWTNEDLSSNLNDVPSFDYPIPTFKYIFQNNSCDCNPTNFSAGRYAIKGVLERYCGGIVIDGGQAIKIEDPVDAEFQTIDQLCVDEPYTFQNESETGCNGNTLPQYSDSVFFSWDFGNCVVIDTSSINLPFPNVVYAYPEAGIYDITLTVSSFCGVTDTTTEITIYPEPNVLFNADPVCENQPTIFQNQTTISQAGTNVLECGDTIVVPQGGEIIQWIWNFGDGNSSPNESPEHTYINPGEYVVTLTVIDENSCSSFYTDTVIVYENPEALFSVPNTCSGNESSIINQEQEGDFPIDTWEWTFENGSITNSTLQNPTGLFFNPNCDENLNQDLNESYNITFIVIDEFECSDTTNGSTTVFCQPIANFSFSEVCENQTTVFNNLSSPQYDMLFSWDFGDNSTSIEQNPTHEFQNCGDYDVQLIISDQNNFCSDDTTILVTQNCNPQAGFTSIDDCAGEPIQLLNTSINGTGQIDTWNWSDNIGITINQENSFLISQQCGILDNQSLTVTDDNNCSDTFTSSIFVYCNPIANFTVDPVCLGENSVFVDSSVDGLADIDTWLWDPNGQGQVTNGGLNTNTLSFLYDSCDYVLASLTVIDQNDCQSTKVDTVKINCNSVANFTLEQYEACGPVDIQAFADESIYNGNYEWTTVPFDNTIIFSTEGTTDSNPSIFFPENNTPTAITYTIQLTTSNEVSSNVFDCESVFTQDVTIYPTPSAQFIPVLVDSCSPLSIAFENQSNPFNSEDISSMSFQWYVNENLSLEEEGFSYIFENNTTIDTTYIVTLFATTIHNCIDSFATTITVYPDPVSQISLINLNDTLNCAPFTIDETVIEANIFGQANDFYEWIYYDVDGNVVASSNTILPPSFEIENEGDSITVMLVVSNEHGCEQDTSQMVFYNYVGPQVQFEVADVCQGETSVFQNTSLQGDAPFVSYSWEIANLGSGEFQNSSSDTSFSPSFLYSSCGTYNALLTIVDQNSCQNTFTYDSVNIFCNPSLEIISTPVCQNTSSDFSLNISFGTTNQISSYQWDMDGLYSLQSGSEISNNIGVIYNDCQTYQPSITIIDDNQCTATNTIEHEVYCNSVANFTLEQYEACGPAQIQAIADISIYNGLYEWTTVPLDNNVTFTSQGTTDSNPSIFFPENNTPSAITYTIQLTTSNEISTGIFECQDVATQDVIIYPTPSADFIPLLSDSCSPFALDFENLSVPFNGEEISSMSFEWFVDGSLSDSTSDFSFVFENNTLNDITYVVELFSSSIHTCIDSLETSITVYPNPVSEISLINLNDTLNCAPFTVDNTVLEANTFEQSNDTYEWIYYNVNGAIVASSNSSVAPTYEIENEGDSLIVMLVTGNEHGCMQDTTQIVFYNYIHPIVQFSVEDACQSTNSIFENNTLEGDSPLDSYNWQISNFGAGSFQNGTNATFSSPIFSYSNCGVFQASLTVTDENSCQNIFTIDSINVFCNPSVEIISTPVCQNTSSDFSLNISLGTTNQISSYQWDMDGLYSLQSGSEINNNISVIYNDCQTYQPSITIVDDNQCIATNTIEYEVYCNAVAELSLLDSTICYGESVEVITTSPSPSWSSFPEGISYSGVTGEFSYLFTPEIESQDSVVYSIILIDGIQTECPAYDTIQFTTYPIPLIEFSADVLDSCGVFTVDFDNLSNPYNSQDTSSMTFNWLVDDISVSNTSTLVYDFISGVIGDTIYNVFLNGSSIYGCSSSDSLSITVYPDPVSIIDTIGNIIDCAPLNIDSLIIAQELVELNDFYSWTVLDSSDVEVASGTGLNAPSWVIFNDNDFVSVILSTENEHGCQLDLDTVVIRTIEDPVADFTVSVDSACHDSNEAIIEVDTTGLSTNGNYTWLVTNQSGQEFYTSTSVSVSTPTITLTNTSNLVDSVYTILLTVGDENGCFHTDTQTVVIHPLPTPYFSTDDNCDGNVIIFEDLSDGANEPIVEWLWDFDDNGITSLEELTTHTFSDFGQYNICLNVINDNNCSNNFCDTLTIRPNPEANFDILYDCAPDSVCSSTLIDFLSTSTVEASLGGNIDSAFWYVDGILEASLDEDNPFVTQFDQGFHTIDLIVLTEYGCSSLQLYTDSINVVDIPSADFNVLNDTLCPDDLLQIELLSSGYITNYQWSIYAEETDTFFTYISSDSLLPIFPELEQGLFDTTYTISLEVSNCCGSDTYNYPVLLKPKPIVCFALTKNELCSQDTVTLTFEPFVFGNTDSIYVDFGDGQFTTIYPDNVLPTMFNNIFHQYFGTENTGADTTYYINIIGFNECGVDSCIDSITVKPLAIQSFFTTEMYYDVDTCENLQVDFIENSFAPIGSEVSWCFDWDSSTSSCNTLFSPISYVLGDTISYTYTEAGTYTVAHAINDLVCNFDTSYFEFVVVFPIPTAEFEFSDVCTNDSVTFFNNSFIDSDIIDPPTQISGYRWYIGDQLFSETTTDFSYSFSTPGSYIISLVAISDRGCVDSTWQTIQIFELPTANFVTDSVCFNNYTSFVNLSENGENNSAINFWSWNFDDIGSVDNIIEGSNQFPNHLYTSNGVFNAVLIVEDNLGCKDTTTQIVRVWDLPEANFVIDTVCQGLNTQLIDLSSQGSGIISQWQWSFNDGTVLTNNDNQATYIFDGCGEFQVELEITDVNSCTDNLTNFARVWCSPTVDFTSTSPCFGDSTQFSNLSFTTDGNNIVSYNWNFGDDTSPTTNFSTLLNPSFIYPECGQYDVSLLITDDLNCSNESSFTTEIICNPEANFTVYDFVCEGDVTNFTNLSTDSIIYPIVDWQWSIQGAGNYENSNSFDVNPSYSFDSCGVYLVTLEVNQDLNNYGCADSITLPVQVYCNPKAEFSTAVECKDTPIQINNLSFVGDAPLTSCSWDFNPNNIPNLVSPQFSIETDPIITFFGAGTFEVDLTVLDTNNCQNILTKEVIVDNPPQVNFTVNNEVCFGEQVNFVADITETSNPIDQGSYFWVVDNINNVFSTDSVFSYVYDVDPLIGGIFNISLSVIDSGNCVGTNDSIISVFPLPNVQFESDDVCENEFPIELINNSNIISPLFNDSIIDWDWDWNSTISFSGQDTCCLLFNPEDYNQAINPGDNFITLNVETSNGCTSFLNKTIEIFPAPIISIIETFSNTTNCGFNNEINLTATLSSDVDDFNWNLDWLPNPFISNIIFIDTVISQPGAFEAMLIGINDYMCTDTALFIDTVFPNPVAVINADSLRGCEMFTVNFSDASYMDNGQLLPSSTITQWNWSFGNNEFDATSGPIDVSYFANNPNGPSEFLATLYVESDGGCYDMDSVFITVLSTPNPIIDVIEIMEPAPHGEFILSATNSLTSFGTLAGIQEFNYNWFIDGQLINQQDIEVQYQFPSNSSYNQEPYEICLEMEAQNGCDTTICIDLNVSFFKGLFVPNAFTPQANSGSIREFKPTGKSLINYTLEIFDTWGNMLWKTNEIDLEDGSPLIGWKGSKIDGTPIPQGVYVWKIEAQFSDGTYWNNVGSVTLIR